MIRYQTQNAEVLFVGINPHPGSFRRGVPFSNNKLFWYLLGRAGLIREKFGDLRDDLKLGKIYKSRFNKVYKLGFINLIDRPTRDITLLRKGEEGKGKRKVETIIKTRRPKVVCFVGKVAYEKYSGSKDFDFGWQKDIYDSRAYVMHFPLRGKAAIRVRELKRIGQARKNKQPHGF